jgi:hypothetical protein
MIRRKKKNSPRSIALAGLTVTLLSCRDGEYLLQQQIRLCANKRKAPRFRIGGLQLVGNLIETRPGVASDLNQNTVQKLCRVLSTAITGSRSRERSTVGRSAALVRRQNAVHRRTANKLHNNSSTCLGQGQSMATAPAAATRNQSSGLEYYSCRRRKHWIPANALRSAAGISSERDDQKPRKCRHFGTATHSLFSASFPPGMNNCSVFFSARHDLILSALSTSQPHHYKRNLLRDHAAHSLYYFDLLKNNNHTFSLV